MAFKACRQCGNFISTQAHACTQCGSPVRRKPSPLLWGCLILTASFFILVVFMFIICSGLMMGSRTSSPRPASPTSPSSTSSTATDTQPPIVKEEHPDAAIEESDNEPDLNAAIMMPQGVSFPSPKELTAAATKARLTADIPWRQSRIGNDYLAIYRNFNGPSGKYVTSAQMRGKTTMEYNEVNCMLEGPTVERVDKVTVEAECYNQAQAHLQNTLLIFVGVLKEIDSELPTDALDRLSAAMVRPQMIGRWKVEARVHQAGADIVATMQR